MPRPVLIHDTEEFRSMWSSGAPTAAIAARLGVTPMSVCRAADRYGYPGRAGRALKLCGPMPEPAAKAEDGALVRPDIPPNDRWPLDLDVALIHAAGRYADLARIATETGRGYQSLLSRWHILRAL